MVGVVNCVLHNRSMVEPCDNLGCIASDYQQKPSRIRVNQKAQKRGGELGFSPNFGCQLGFLAPLIGSKRKKGPNRLESILKE